MKMMVLAALLLQVGVSYGVLFPAKVGEQWMYEGTDTSGGQWTESFDFVKIEIIDGFEYVVTLDGWAIRSTDNLVAGYDAVSDPESYFEFVVDENTPTEAITTLMGTFDNAFVRHTPADGFKEVWDYFVQDVGFVRVVENEINGEAVVNTQTIDLTEVTISPSVKPVDYWVAGAAGDTWTYEYRDGRIVDAALEIIETGPNAGRTQFADSIAGVIFDYSDSIMTWYQFVNETPFDEPIVFTEYTLDKEIPAFGDAVIFRLLNNVEVQAGTFDDVLLVIWLDSKIQPNSQNQALNLQDLTDAAVTDLDWWAKGVGAIKYYDIDAASGDIVSGYELTAYDIATDTGGSSRQDTGNTGSDNGSGGNNTDSGGSGGGSLNLLWLLAGLLSLGSRRYYRH